MKNAAAAAVSGILFGLGLGISGMTDPSKVIGFLDLFGAWDPALAFVMGGAVVTYLVAFRLITRRAHPVFAERFSLPTRRDVDVRLLGGAALFGIGWGLSGVCPGPAITSVPAGAPGILAFVVAMAGGMVLYRAVDRIRSARAAAASAPAPAPIRSGAA